MDSRLGWQRCLTVGPVAHTLRPLPFARSAPPPSFAVAPHLGHACAMGFVPSFPHFCLLLHCSLVCVECACFSKPFFLPLHASTVFLLRVFFLRCFLGFACDLCFCVCFPPVVSFGALCFHVAVLLAGVRLRVGIHLFVWLVCISFLFAAPPAGVRPRVDTHLFFLLLFCAFWFFFAVPPAGVRPRVDTHLVVSPLVIVHLYFAGPCRRRPPPCGL